MTYNRFTVLTLFGILLALIATMASWPFTLLVSAQTGIDGGADTLNSVANDTATATGNNNMTEVKLLFIQGAESGSISEVNATTKTLQLNDVSDKTILFSDRPDRIVSTTNTTDFIGNWSTGTNSFGIDPPNAVLVLDDEQQKQELAVIELYNPEYDPEANTLKFDITAENATSSLDLPLKFGQSTLVIDENDETDVFVPGIEWSGGAGEEAPGE